MSTRERAKDPGGRGGHAPGLGDLCQVCPLSICVCRSAKVGNTSLALRLTSTPSALPSPRVPFAGEIDAMTPCASTATSTSARPDASTAEEGIPAAELASRTHTGTVALRSTYGGGGTLTAMLDSQTATRPESVRRSATLAGKLKLAARRQSAHTHMALWEAVPSIDFSAFPVGTCAAVDERWTPNEAQLEVCARIDEVCRVHGFCTLRNTGVTPAELDASFGAGRALFAMDPSQKAQLAVHDKKTGGNRGYFPFRTEALDSRRANDVKEAFNVRRTAMDWRGCPDGFAARQTAMYETAAELADRFLLACAVALGLDDPLFFTRRHVDKDLCTLRLLHYPALDAAPGSAAVGGEAEPTQAVRAGEHTDFGAVTFVFVSTAGGPDAARGLQVRKPAGHVTADTDCWLDVTPGPGEVVVNTGGLLAQWTNDYWTATSHRVIVTPAALQQPRYSLAFFVDPDSEEVIECLPRFCSDAAPPRYAPITSKAYLLAKLAEAQQRPGVTAG